LLSPHQSESLHVLGRDPAFISAHRYFIPTAFWYAEFAKVSAFSKSFFPRYALAKNLQDWLANKKKK
jgi:hypothetical protein